MINSQFLFLVLLAETSENTDAPISGNNSNNHVTGLHQTHPHIFQHQSSISSQVSVQTVFYQNGCIMGSSGSSQQSQGSANNVMIGSIYEEPLNVGDVADLLHPQYAIITGGRSNDGCPIIQFPDHNNFQTLTDADYQKLIKYLCSVPT